MNEHIPIGKFRASFIMEVQKILSMALGQLKAVHGMVCGRSGAGKTFALTALVFGIMKQSILRRFKDPLPNADTFVLLDPHNSNIPPLLSLLKDFYASHPKCWATSRIFKYRKSEPDETYRGHYLLKVLRMNPLVSKRLSKDFTYLDKASNLNMAALKSIFDFSSFGPRNTEAIEAVVRASLFMNAAELRSPQSEKLISYADLYEFFSVLKTTGRLPDWFSKRMSPLLTSSDPAVKKLADRIRRTVKLFPSNMAANKEYYDTTITKFKDFSGEFAKSFGQGLSHSELTLDMESVFSGSETETRGIFLDLSGFSNRERKVVVAFFYSGSYYLGSLKDHASRIGTNWMICDEFRSFLETKGRKSPLIDLLEHALNELRKYKVSYVFVARYVPQRLREMLTNLSFVLVFALPPERAEIFSELLSYGTDETTPDAIDGKRISNLERGRFFASFDTVHHGLLTVLAKSLDINDPSVRKFLTS